MLTYSLEQIGTYTIYEYLYRCIREDILSKKIKQGDRLPSKRSFARNMQISVITVENAYAQLLAEGYIYSVEKKGYFVNDVENLNEKSITGTRTKNAVIEEKNEYFMDFVSNTVDFVNFPLSIWTKLVREIITTEKSENILKTSPTGGVMKLREAISEHLYHFRGMDIEPFRIIIGAGTEYLYNLIIQLLGRQNVFAVEDPGYSKITEIYRSNDVVCRHIGMDGSGIDMNGLNRYDPDVIHITPSHHFPTGIVMPVSRRYEILNWASEKGSRYIIEDDYDSEFRLSGRPIPALQSIDMNEKVIYINTFSKSLAPSIRISYMVLPKHLITEFNRKLGFYSCTVPNFEQYILSEFIARGYFEKHINRMRNHYRSKRDRILETVKNSALGPHVEIEEEDSGLHFLLHIHTGMPDDEVAAKAKKIGINISAISQYYYNKTDAREHLFIINYSGIDINRIEEAISMLTKLLFG
ncbi:MAG: PLP-dependent aminotransferase family protein [Clostridia bacterium]